MRIGKVAVLVGVVSAMGCSDSSSSSGAGARDGDVWALEPVVRIGSVDGVPVTVFGRVVSVVLGGEGRVYVLDAQAAEVRVFDRHGSHERTFGGRGQGPGELLEPSTLAIDDGGNVWVSDSGNGRYQVFSGEGALLRTYPRPIRRDALRGRMRVEGDRLHDFATLELIQESERGVNVRSLGPGLIRSAVGEEVVAIDTVPMGLLNAGGFSVSGGGAVFEMTPPYAPEQAFDVAPGGAVWVGFGDQYTMHKLDGRSDTVVTVDRSVARVPFSPESRRQVEEWVEGALGQGFEGEESSVPSGYPYFSRIAVADDGTVWVARQSGESEWFFEVFTEDGEYLGSVATSLDLGDGGVDPYITRSHVVGVETNPQGVQFISVFRIGRPSSR